MPSNVPGLDARITKVIEAAIAAEMYDYGYYGTCAQGFEGYSRATEELPISDLIRIGYPDGRIFRAGFDSPAEDLAPMFAGDYTHASQLFRKWEDEIQQNFERFEDLPSPSTFTHTLERLGDLGTALDAGGAYLGGRGSDTRAVLGNVDLAGYVEGLRGDMAGFTGATIETLNSSYLVRIDEVVAGQQVLVATLAAVVAGEREVWTATHEDLRGIADDAASAFLQYAGGGPANDDAKTGFLVLGAIATALSFTGAGMVIAAAALNAVGTFMPEAPEGPKIQLAGGSVSEIHGNLLLTLSDQCRGVADVERAFAECATAAMEASEANPDYFDFATAGDPLPFLEAGTGADYLGPGETLMVQGPELREAAARLEAIAGVLRHIRDDLPTLSSWAWERYHIVGLGRWGHHPETEALLTQVEAVLDRSATRMSAVAAKMVLASHDFERTDEEVLSELERLQATIPDPTPNQDLKYGHPTSV